MLEKELRDKLLREFKENRNSRELGFIKELYKAAKVELTDTNKFRVIFDLKLEKLLSKEKEYSLKTLLRKHIDELIVSDEYDTEDLVEIISGYVKKFKISLNIARNEGIEEVKNPVIIIKEFEAVYSKYLGAYKEYSTLDNAKKRIEAVLTKLGYKEDEKDIFNQIKFYYNKDSRKIAAAEALKENKENCFNLSLMLAENLAKRKNIKIDLIKLLKIDSDEKCKEAVKEIEIGDENHTVIENSDSKAENIKIGDKNETPKENSNFEDKSLENQIEHIKEELEIERIMNKEEKDKLIEEIQILRKEKLENMEYVKKQYQKAFEDIIKVLNDKNYGCILDKFYEYSKGYVSEVNHKALAANLITALQSLGIRAIEKEKINSDISIKNSEIYKFRFIKAVDKDGSIKGKIKSPAWFYKNDEIIKQFIEVKEDK